MSKIHIIWNPVAGNGRAAGVFAAMEKKLTELGVDYSAAKSAYPGHATQLAARALKDGHESILAIGGDGTVREVASVIRGQGVPLGIIPSGTGNDLARALKLPRDPLAALDVVLAGNARQMDAATANGELFFNIAGFGFDVDVLDYVEIYKKKYRNGSIAYLRGLLAAITKLTIRKTTIATPEGTQEMNALLIAAANGNYFGGGMHIAPKADPFDGLLDVCVIHDVNKLSLLSLLRHLGSGKHIEDQKHVAYFRTTSLSCACEPASRLDIDGEVMPGTPVSFEIVPGALSVFVP